MPERHPGPFFSPLSEIPGVAREPVARRRVEDQEGALSTEKTAENQP
jgi:hypothetical protein